MSKSVVNTRDLVASDFRKIKQLLLQKNGTAFTLDYIRKVCKGKRNNADIKDMATKYSKLIKEMKAKIDKLSQQP